MSNLKIKGIRIEDSLQLDWEVGFCSEDYAYLKYGNYEEINLSERPDSKGICFEGLEEVVDALGGVSAYVMIPDESTVATAQELMQVVIRGEEIEQP